MRTTVTLENDVARMLDDHARRTRKSFKETLNQAVRLGLGRASNAEADFEFVIEPRDMGLRSEIDGAHFNSLLDEMEADVFHESNVGRVE